MHPRPSALPLLASWLLTAALFLTGCGPQDVTVAINPTSANVAPGGTFVFTAQVTGANDPSVLWSLPGGASAGSISSSGVYTAPQTPGVYDVVATSVEDRSRSATAKVTVTAGSGPAITVSPDPVTVQTGAKQTFTAQVTGTTDRRVTWSVREGAAGGSISVEGTYTAPSTPGTYHLEATSVASPQVSASATVTVTRGNVVSVSISPATPNVVTGQFLPFTATPHGGVGYSAELEWSVLEQEGGGITCKGTYLAPSRPGLYHVAAAYRPEPGRRALATVDVQQAPGLSVWIAPRDARVPPQGKQTFSARVSGTPNPDVTWSIREGALGGTITPEGVYTAPTLPSGTSSARYTLVATSKADPSRSAEAFVDVTPSSGTNTLSINPSTVRLRPGAATSFSATLYYGQGVSYGTRVVDGSGVSYGPLVRWRVLEASGGSVTPEGGYLAPNTPGIYHLAAEAEDCEASAFSTVTVE
jgi:hypothetical protein